MELEYCLQIRVFRFLTGKLYRVFDESIAIISEQHQVTCNDVIIIKSCHCGCQVAPQLQNMEFGRRLAVERELLKSTAIQFYNAGMLTHNMHLKYNTCPYVYRHSKVGSHNFLGYNSFCATYFLLCTSYSILLLECNYCFYLFICLCSV